MLGLCGSCLVASTHGNGSLLGASEIIKPWLIAIPRPVDSARPCNMTKRASSEEVEKTGEVSITESLSLDDKDEALQLVGLERAGSISEEQFRRVRWKLVRTQQFAQRCLMPTLFYPGSDYPTTLCDCLLLTIPVRPKIPSLPIVDSLARDKNVLNYARYVVFSVVFSRRSRHFQHHGLANYRSGESAEYASRPCLSF